MSTNQLFFRCAKEMMTHPFLADNPVINGVKNGTLSSKQLGEILFQYIRLPEEIVSFLQGAASHFSKDHGIHRELERNWRQEQGSETGGVPHVAILKESLKQNLSLNANHVTGDSATETFIQSVSDGMSHDPWFALGQAYALEASAIPELSMLVGPAINAYAHLIGKKEPIQKNALHVEGGYSPEVIHSREEALRMDMSTWFAMHILDFEVSHRDLLQNQVQMALLQGGDSEQFKCGFDHVLNSMDAWWEALAKNIK